ncbi:hypothetical protein BDM02DRAFT_3133000 [Thelephora ganbajun]|uniref:Uncharacterized protein n=1 Tax=Thelephora ganbajun TaxID=370292 RepID=A0ACB6YYP4_THEGA|nr:hypothetical protein BDM02DRAFT_3133000 [Thelephora ganbajun]
MFVRFIYKPAAEWVIEKMRGFPVGGGRVRLSWGHSQCRTNRSDAKSSPPASDLDFIATPVTQQKTHPNITGEQAAEILQKLGLANLLVQSNLALDTGILGRLNSPPGGGGIPFRDDENVRSSVDTSSRYQNRCRSNRGPRTPSFHPTSFSPFSSNLRVRADDRKTTQELVGARLNKSFSPVVGENLSNLPLSDKASPVGFGSGLRTSAGMTTPCYGSLFGASTN